MVAGLLLDEAEKWPLLPSFTCNIVGVATKSSWEERPLEEQSWDIPTLPDPVQRAYSICLMLLYTVEITAAVALRLLTVEVAASTSRNPAH